MALKNYSTAVSVENTIMELEKILTMHGARGIAKEFDREQNITSIMFTVETKFGLMPFKLSTNAEAIRKVIMEEWKAKKARGISEAKSKDLDHARRVGWRIIKDMVDSQLARVKIEMVDIVQVFLPYAYDYGSEKTLYEKLAEGGFKELLLEGKVN